MVNPFSSRFAGWSGYLLEFFVEPHGGSDMEDNVYPIREGKMKSTDQTLPVFIDSLRRPYDFMAIRYIYTHYEQEYMLTTPSFPNLLVDEKFHICRGEA